jgi:hypothetical protein
LPRLALLLDQKTLPSITMSAPEKGKSVSELKRWLARFGEKNQEHFELNQVGTFRARSIQRRIEKFNSPMTATNTGTIAKGETTEKETGIESTGSFDKTLNLRRRLSEPTWLKDPTSTDKKESCTVPSVAEEFKEPEPPVTTESPAVAAISTSYSEANKPTEPEAVQYSYDTPQAIEEAYSSSSAESMVDVHDQEEAAIETISKPVFRDFSNFMFQPSFLKSASSDDAADDKPGYNGEKSRDQVKATQERTRPQSWEELDDFPSQSWDEEYHATAPKWHPNAMPLIIHAELASDSEYDGFHETSSVGVRRDDAVGSFQKFTDGAKTLVGRRNKSSKVEKYSSSIPRRLIGKAAAAVMQGAPVTTTSESRGFEPKSLSTTTSMYNATICGTETLTSSSLDYLCNGTYPITDAASQSSLDQDSNTVSTWSEDSVSPSVLPDALEYSMSRMFASQETGSKSTMDSYDYHASRRLGKILPPPILEVSTMEEADDISVRACHSYEESNRPSLNGNTMDQVLATNSFSSLLPSETLSTCASTMTVTSDGSANVFKHFKTGTSSSLSEGKLQSAVERAKVELEQQWAAAKEPVHVKKIQWAVDRKTGGYKKKIVLVSSD